MKKMGKGAGANSDRGECAMPGKSRSSASAVEDATWADVDLSDWIDSSEPQLSLPLAF